MPDVAAQLAALVEEAALLSEALAGKLADGVGRYESPTAGRPSAGTLARASMPDADPEAREPGEMAGWPGDTAEGMALTPAALPAPPVGTPAVEDAAAAEPTWTAAAQRRGAGVHGPAGAATSPITWDAADVQVAREKGMDPLGVALQRSLAR